MTSATLLDEYIYMHNGEQSTDFSVYQSFETLLQVFLLSIFLLSWNKKCYTKKLVRIYYLGIVSTFSYKYIYI